MSTPVNPTPKTPADAEDRTYRVVMDTVRPAAGATTDYPVKVLRERRQYNADGSDCLLPDQDDIPATVDDGGKPEYFSFVLTDLLGTVGQGRQIDVTSPLGNVSFKLAQIGELIIAAIESIAGDNVEARKLLKQLEAGQITQAEYEAAIALLIRTS